MLVDELKIYAKAGKGGDGVVRWRSERGKPKMGPAGGNGGKGGNVYIRAVRDINILSSYKNKKEFIAENGGDGMKNSMEGKDGEDLIIDLPIGSTITDLKDEKKITLLEENEQILILKGGHGGLGNERFKSSTNTTPQEFTAGKSGHESEFFIELIADVGFIGLPSSGKSSLLNELTNTKAKVGAYPFTTLEPNLGELYSYILADIPGLIEGASEGKGLGHKFLRHIKRTKALVHCVSLENEDVLDAYNTIRKELINYDEKLAEKKELVILTKSDLVDSKSLEETKKKIKKINPEVKTVSIYDDGLIKELSDYLIKILKK